MELNPGSSGRPSRLVCTVPQPTEPPRQVFHGLIDLKSHRLASCVHWLMAYVTSFRSALIFINVEFCVYHLNRGSPQHKFKITDCLYMMRYGSICVFVSYFYIFLFLKFLFRAATGAFKPFCLVHIVLCNINIYSLYYIFWEINDWFIWLIDWLIDQHQSVNQSTFIQSCLLRNSDHGLIVHAAWSTYNWYCTNMQSFTNIPGVQEYKMLGLPWCDVKWISVL